MLIFLKLLKFSGDCMAEVRHSSYGAQISRKVCTETSEALALGRA